MGRLVRKSQGPDTAFQITGLDDIFAPEVVPNPAAKAEPGDGYLERMLKYIPAETVAFSMIINAILDQAVKTSGKNALMAGLPVTTIAWAVLLAGLILTPLLCWYVHKDGDAWVVNAVVSTLAFPFWAYLMDAVEFADFHDGNLAAILVLTFTAVSGLVTPFSREPARRESRATATDGPPLLASRTNLRERVTDLLATARARDA
jgi:uncharacterized Tic20 family protein